MEELINYIKSQQEEYKVGTDAYNILRKLETTIPNIVNKNFAEKNLNYFYCWDASVGEIQCKKQCEDCINEPNQ